MNCGMWCCVSCCLIALSLVVPSARSLSLCNGVVWYSPFGIVIILPVVCLSVCVLHR